VSTPRVEATSCRLTNTRQDDVSTPRVEATSCRLNNTRQDDVSTITLPIKTKS